MNRELMERSGRPRARVGLPSGPAPRSRSVHGRREDLPRPASTAEEFIPFRPAPTPPLQQLRQPRSISDLRSSPVRSRSVDSKRHVRPASPPPPVPSPPSAWQTRWSPTTTSPTIRSPSVKSPVIKSPVSGSPIPLKRSDSTAALRSSTSSESSMSQSSLRSFISRSSSRTSVEDSFLEMGGADGQKGRFEPPQSPDSAENQSPNGLRSVLWNRVANVADNLRVNVSKALGASLEPETGEVTPFGEESRLTRAMKAYHIEKARDANDLPDWLFEGRDQEVISRLRGAPSSSVDSKSEPTAQHQVVDVSVPHHRRDTSRSNGDNSKAVAVSAWAPAHSRASSGSSAQSVHSTVPPRDAMNRLKQLRLAKRNARVRFADDNDDDDAIDTMPAMRMLLRPPTPDASRTARTAPTVSPTRTDENIPRRRPTVHAKISRDGSISRIGLPSSVRPQRS
ncbi:uncharacterized protein FIBRA_01142 [Fibroporia radiculosa]|uniref:Uncharacterized protein n=1 Tax=Fibroporia radiculosa TaxID=599839 RepID=J4G0T8_9APHY|nr:uncharacterized protein FIBRA_01142 [Fibroporia radiculosa]CCL99128.1 predicted protein [Fibroporia radiculosa]